MPGILKNRHHEIDPLWHVQLTMAVALLLQLALPDRFSFGTRYVMPVIEALLIVALSLTTPREKIFRSLQRRLNVIALLATIGVANSYSLSLVAGQLLHGGKLANGQQLILTAINIYLTNVIVFALWYWEMDGGGPGERQRIEKHEQDFLFPQQQNEVYSRPGWKPTFIDYLYTSSTNAMAFSPTDTMPLSRRAKMLMLVQATVSLIAIALVAARAVNILT